MIDLVRHLVEPLVEHPDEVHIQVVEGEAAVILEMSTHPDARAALESDEGRAVRAIRNVLSAAAGKRKATMDLVNEDEFTATSEE